MRLDSVLDALYLLGSLWSPLSGLQVCSSSADATSIAYAVPWSPVLGAPAEVTAFVDVNVIPMDSDRVLAHQTVLVESGRILALGPTRQVEVPAGAMRIDGRGKYLMPGLADMHAHSGTDSAERYLFGYLAHGVTTIRPPDGVGAPFNEEFLRLETRGVSPRLYLPAPITGNMKLKLDSVAASVAAAKAAGYGYILTSAREVHARDTLPVVDSLLAAARRLGLPVVTHDHEQNFEKVLALGTVGGSSEHLYAFQDFLKRPEDDIATGEIQARATAAQRAGAWITVTLVCAEYANRSHTAKIKLARRIVKALQDADAGMLLGSDVNGGRGSSAGIVHTELALLVGAGLTPYQALLTGTRNVAQYLGTLDSSGTVAVGKWADLVLLYGNPLTHVRHTREPAGVMIRGRWLDRATLDQGLLASPKHWFRVQVWGSMLPQSPGEEGFRKTRRHHVEKFDALTDSLELAKSSEGERGRTYQRLLQQLALELGATRAVFPSDQRDAFDPHARMWLRDQARRGYRVAIPGVAPTP